MIREESPNYRGTTLREFIYHAQPADWESTDWDLERWFEWPPDVFALTSLILNYTGAYRLAISPNAIWPEATWPHRARSIAAKWRNNLTETQMIIPDKLKERIQILMTNQDVFIDELYDSFDEQDTRDDGNPWEVCRTLLELHGIADEAMQGVGIVFSPRTLLRRISAKESLNIDDTQESRKNQEFYSKGAFFYLQANYLLALRGSLSRIPKYRGIVLPKSRTPQVGLSLRSLSNHLTFHQTEVDVAWRAFPWFNLDENTLNIMVIPWPYEISATNFSSILHPGTREHLGAQRYFHYEPKSDPDFDVEQLIAYITDAKKEVRRIHLLVFPEMALRTAELEKLKKSLREKLLPHEMPMIIAGVSARLKDDTDGSSSEPNEKKRQHFRSDSVGYNRVILSVFYAEKWHDVIQDKHHRWRVDTDQIEQYNLGGILSGSRTWWEAIHVSRRRLSVLAANSWLTICPLICEDLARQEPVSDLIRGIGPTLLTALLLDGPQLKERWSARYASVLADDPGSSVLTLTSLGMSRRSRLVGPTSEKWQKIAEEKTNTIALWKDQEKGWKEIRVGESGEIGPKVLIVSAVLTSEATIDGRTEDENSAVFTYQGTYEPLQTKSVPKVSEDLGRQAEEDSKQDYSSDQGGPEKENDQEPLDSREEDADKKELKVLDICELTLYTYYVDALADSLTDPEALRSWFNKTVRIEDIDENSKFSRLSSDIIRLNRYSIQTRDSVPELLPSPHLMYAIDKATKLVAKIKKGKDWSDLPEYWEALVDESERMLKSTLNDFIKWTEKPNEKFENGIKKDFERAIKMSMFLTGQETKKRTPIPIWNSEIGRLRLSTPLSILWAVHVRLATRRRYGTLQPEDASLLERIEKILAGELEDFSDENYHTIYLRWKKAWRKNGKAEQRSTIS